MIAPSIPYSWVFESRVSGRGQWNASKSSSTALLAEVATIPHSLEVTHPNECGATLQHLVHDADFRNPEEAVVQNIRIVHGEDYQYILCIVSCILVQPDDLLQCSGWSEDPSPSTTMSAPRFNTDSITAKRRSLHCVLLPIPCQA